MYWGTFIIYWSHAHIDTRGEKNNIEKDYQNTREQYLSKLNITLTKAAQSDFFFGSNKQKEKVFDEPMNIKEHASQTENY